MRFSRLAVYHLPDGELGDWGAEWLGWDARSGDAVTSPDIARRGSTGSPDPEPETTGLDVAALTAIPRRYGFHATLKAPFRLVEGCVMDDVALALDRIAARHAPLRIPLHLSHDWGFLALRPIAPPPALGQLEAALVCDLDRFRAPLSAAEIARRRPELLPAAARTHLHDWGYPFVLDLFHYHLTLTGPLERAERERAADALAPQLAPLLAQPALLGALALMGEDAEGRFHRISEFPLTASCASETADR